MTTNVLIVNTGQQDLKPWYVDVDDREATPRLLRMRGGRANVRRFHRFLLDNPDKWQIAESMEAVCANLGRRLAPGRLVELDYRAGDKQEPLPVVNEDDRKFEPAQTGGGVYQLYPAKTAGLVSELLGGPDATGDRIPIHRVLVLATHRETGNPRYLEGEPIATGPVLTAWIAEQFGLPLYGELDDVRTARDGIYWANCLKGRELMEGKADANVPIDTQNARNVDSAIAGIAAGLSTPVAILSETGGMGDLKTLIRASIRLRFQNRIRVATGTQETPGLAQLSSTVPSRAESLDARARAESRLWKGDFPGAWAAAAHLRESQLDAPWVQALRALAEIALGGSPEHASGDSSLQRLADDPHTMLLRSAFAVEAALQAHQDTDCRLGEAVIATRTFADHLLHTALAQELAAHEAVRSVDPVTWRIVFHNGEVPADLHDDPDSKSCQQRGPRIKNRTEGYVVDDREASGKWRKWLHEERGRTALHMCLDRYFDARTPVARSVNHFRNDQAHRALDAAAYRDLITAATFDGSGGPLWQMAEHDFQLDDLGRCFLSVPVVRDALEEMGITDPQKRYRDVIAEVLVPLRAPIDVVPD